MIRLVQAPPLMAESQRLIGCLIAYRAGVCCVQVVNTSEQLLLIPNSVVGKNTLFLVRKQKWEFLRRPDGFVLVWITLCYSSPPSLSFFKSSPMVGVQSIGQKSRAKQLFFNPHCRAAPLDGSVLLCTYVSVWAHSSSSETSTNWGCGKGWENVLRKLCWERFSTVNATGSSHVPSFTAADTHGFVIHPVSRVCTGREGGSRTSPTPLFGLAQNCGPDKGHERAQALL